MIKSHLARILTAKVIAVTAGGLAIGGGALAAASTSGPARPALVQTQASSGAAGGVLASPGITTATPHSAPSTVTALCHRLAATSGAGSTTSADAALASTAVSQALGNQVFSSLVVAASGRVAVPDYCALMLGLPALPQPGTLAQLPSAFLAQQLPALPAGELASVLGAVPGADLSQVLTGLPAAALAQVLTTLPTSGLSQVLTALPAGALTQILTRLPEPALAQVLTSLPNGALSQVLKALPASVVSQILGKLPSSALAQLPASVLDQLPSSVLSQLPLG